MTLDRLTRHRKERKFLHRASEKEVTMPHNESLQPTASDVRPMPTEQGPLEPVRVKTFAHFFKSYMSISAVAAAALPIPVTSLKLIPTFAAQTPLLSTYTSLFCFLLLAFIFYSRHALGMAMFPRERYMVARIRAVVVGIAPAALIFASLVCIFYYHVRFSASVKILDQSGAEPVPEILQNVPLWEIPNGEALILWYLGIFVFAEAAFIMMALREYLQDLLKIQEVELIYPPVPEYTHYVDKAALLRAIAEYRKQVTAGKRTEAGFLEWAAERHLDEVVDAVAVNLEWQREIHQRLEND